ncbi:N-6 DNA methylase [Corynebacterium aurimucosum]|uniref:HsdM family class I SAM-dependent methyltransferase n=1 Tax=Corynebacterium aurimucosum TaxID=169292 RepID=UPI00187A643E|nr:N-6 DNA methylase [Corynebacterium aurimucosum]MBE7364417.1 N-6 DNA methylase [Corynebacterium aurimucosum]
MKFKSEQGRDKLRGGYYTPQPVAEFLTRWLIDGGCSTILEPSCGDGAFFRAMETLNFQPPLIHGVERDPDEAEKANSAMQAESDFMVYNADFLKFTSSAEYDGVLGNPPFIRYQFLEEQTQELAKRLYDSHRLPFTKHLNAWAPFVVKSLDMLTPGGRLAMVIPAEIMTVSHASGIRKFLLEQCSRVLLIDTQDLIFDGALQRTILLLAEKQVDGNSNTCKLATVHKSNLDFLTGDPSIEFNYADFRTVPASSEKWMASLLSPDEISAYQRMLSSASVSYFDEIATAQVGIVTGANKFFLVTDEVVNQYDLHAYAYPMFGRSNHIQGVTYSEAVHQNNKKNGYPTNFIFFPATDKKLLGPGASKYVDYGESQNLHTRYKTRIRSPWYAVPSVYRTSLSLLKRSHQAPRLIFNEMQAFTTDTAYRISTSLDPVSLTVSWFNSLTVLGAELLGRSYGGGVLELIPSEIRKLPIPFNTFSRAELDQLDNQFLLGRPTEEILERQDKLVLGRAGFSEENIRLIQSARKRLSSRRIERMT